MWTSAEIRKAYGDFFRGMAPTCPTHFLTVTLTAPDTVTHVENFNSTGQGKRYGFIRQAINVIDLRLYGRKHRDIPDTDKFDFAVKVEKVSKAGDRIPAHFHYLLEIGDKDRVRFDATWTRNSDVIRRAISRAGFRPTVHIVPVDDVEGIKSYFTKWSIDDADEVYTRNTLQSSLHRW